MQKIMANDKKRGCGCSIFLLACMVLLIFCMLGSTITSNTSPAGNKAKETSQPTKQISYFSVDSLSSSAKTKQPTATPVPTSTPAPTATPEPTATTQTTLSVEEIKALLEKSLKAGTDYYTIECDNTGMTVNMAFNGLYNEVVAAISLGIENNTWADMRATFVETCARARILMMNAGVENPLVMFSIVNDTATDYVMLSIVNGEVIYDVMQAYSQK